MYMDDEFDDIMPTAYRYPGRNFMRYSGRQTQFVEYYSAYPIAMYPGNKGESNYGGKIFMPQQALEDLSRLEVVYPMLFKLEGGEDTSNHTRTHCGVLEFTAEMGRVYLPQWMMEALKLQPGDMVKATNVALLKGALVKLQPQSVDFLNISDHRAVLENALRKFSALTVGDIIAIDYNNKEYKLEVLETQPSPSAINIVETDLSVDFAPPVGYVEPQEKGSGASSMAAGTPADSRPSSSIAKEIKRQEVAAKDEISSTRFAAFRGSGQRLSSKKAIQPSSSTTSFRSYAGPAEAADKDSNEEDGQNNKPVVPLEDVPIGTLFFGYDLVPPPGSETMEEPSEAQQQEMKFGGEGRVLRKRRNNRL